MTQSELLRLEGLIPETRKLVELLVDRMRARGFDCYIGSTRRTQAEQEQARLAGKTSATQVRSWHELGRAVDIRPRKKNGGPNYDVSEASEPFWRALWEESKVLGMRCLGFTESGDKLFINTVRGKVRDPGHVEHRGPYATLREALAKEQTRG